jgi:hypothetical protein
MNLVSLLMLAESWDSYIWCRFLLGGGIRCRRIFAGGTRCGPIIGCLGILIGILTAPIIFIRISYDGCGLTFLTFLLYDLNFYHFIILYHFILINTTIIVIINFITSI